MHYMIVQFNDGSRQWYYGTETGLKLMLRGMTDVKNATVEPIKNQLTD